MAKKKAQTDAAADSPEPVAVPFVNAVEAIAASESGEPVQGDVISVMPLREKEAVADVFGRVLVGPVVCEGLRYEDVPHRRAYNLTINGRECHFVGDVGDAREYRPLGRR